MTRKENMQFGTGRRPCAASPPSYPAGPLSLKGRRLLMLELNSVIDMSGERELLYLEDKKAKGSSPPGLPVSLR